MSMFSTLFLRKYSSPQSLYFSNLSPLGVPISHSIDLKIGKAPQIRGTGGLLSHG